MRPQKCAKIEGGPMGLRYEKLARFFPQYVQKKEEEISKSKNTFVNPAPIKEIS